jgi:hypothetical protein
VKRIALLFILTCLAAVAAGLIVSADANAATAQTSSTSVVITPTVYIGDGGANWSCTDADAAAGKMLYGWGSEGAKYYKCVHKGWTQDDLFYSWGNYYWVHNGLWPFVAYANRSAWEGQ